MPMSGAEFFFDTNVILYLLSADPATADRAEELLAIGGVISVQVLNAFAAIAFRKLVGSQAREHPLSGRIDSYQSNPKTCLLHWPQSGDACEWRESRP